MQTKRLLRHLPIDIWLVWFGKAKWFKKFWRGKLDKIVKNLQDRGVESTPYCDKEW